MGDRQDDSAWVAPTGVSPGSAWPAPPASSPAATGPSAAPPGAPYGGAPAPVPTSASWQPGFMPLRPLTFGDLLGLPFRAMRYNRTVIVGGPLLFTLVATVATAAGMWLLFTDPSLGLLDPASELDSVSANTVAVLVVAVVAALLADVFSSAIVAPGVARGALGERIRLADAWAAMRPRVGSLLLLYVIATGAMLVVVGLALVPFFVGAANEDIAALLSGLLLAFVLAVPVGILVTLVGGLARPIVVLERRGAIAAIRRAVHLLRGRFWWSLLVIFVAAVVIGIVSSVVNQVGSFGAVVVTLVAPENVVATAIAFFIVTSLSLVVSYVLTYSYLGSLFALVLIDLRIRHEGFDLTLAEAAEARRR